MFGQWIGGILITQQVLMLGLFFLTSFCEGKKIILVKFIIMYVKNIFVMKDQIDLFKCKVCMWKIKDFCNERLNSVFKYVLDYPLNF